MLKFNNLSPKKVAFGTAILLSVPTALIAGWITKNIWVVLFVFCVYLLVVFLIVFLLVENFVNKRIKLIFKFIYNTKAGKRQEMYNKYILPRKSLDEVHDDVIVWADRKEKELDVLRKNENYRKEFLQNLAHEFKTPLFSIQGYVEILLDGAYEDNEVSKRFLSNSHKNILRLTYLIKDLDEISRLENSEQKLNFEKFCIQDQIKYIFDTLHIEAVSKGITCQMKKGNELPVIVYADKEKINRVLTNLVNNAIIYGKHGGHILAGLYKTDDNTVLIEITDNGTGIGEDAIPRIFERFYRTESGRLINTAGSGLGLSICKHIIEAHNQSIHARSTVDVGTTVGFTLALAKHI